MFQRPTSRHRLPGSRSTRRSQQQRKTLGSRCLTLEALEPRAIKRCPKPHDLLTEPRDQARARLRGNPTP